MNPEEPKQEGQPKPPTPDTSFTGSKQIMDLSEPNALEEVGKLATQLDKIEILESGALLDVKKIQESLLEIGTLRTILHLASGHQSPLVKKSVEDLLVKLREKREVLRKMIPEEAPSSTSGDRVQDDVVVTAPQITEEEKERLKTRRSEDALSEIGESLKDVPTTLNELKQHYEAYEVALKKYARTSIDEYTDAVRTKAAEALMELTSRIKELEEQKESQEIQQEAVAHGAQSEVIDITKTDAGVSEIIDLDVPFDQAVPEANVSQPAPGVSTGQIDINLSEDAPLVAPPAEALEPAPITEQAPVIEVPAVESVGATPITEKTPKPESAPISDEHVIEKLKAEGIIVPSSPEQPPQATNENGAPQEVPILRDEVVPTPAPASVSAPDSSLDFTPRGATEPAVEKAPTQPVVPPSTPEAPRQESVQEGITPSVLRPPKNVTSGSNMFGRVLRMFRRKPEEKKQLTYLEWSNTIAKKIEEKSKARVARAEALEKAKKITNSALESWKSLGKNYNELSKEKKILLGLGLATSTLAFGVGAVAIPYTALRLVSSTGLFLTLDKAMEVAHIAKTGEERTRGEKYRHRASAIMFSFLVGSGLAVDAVRELFPQEMVPASTPPAEQEKVVPQPETPPIIETPREQPVFDTSSVGSAPEAIVQIPEYQVKSGDSLYKIIKENIPEIKSLPAGHQEAAIMNVLEHMKNDPQFYGVSSGDLEKIIAGKDTISLEKIREILDIRDLIKGESILEHVQKLDPEKVLENISTGASQAVETTQPPQTETISATPETDPVLEEVQVAMKDRLDAIFGTKNVFGTIEVAGEKSKEWLAIKERPIGDLLSEKLPSKPIAEVKNLLGNLSLESGLPVVRGEHVEDYIERALLKISEDRATATV